MEYRMYEEGDISNEDPEMILFLQTLVFKARMDELKRQGYLTDELMTSGDNLGTLLPTTELSKITASRFGFTWEEAIVGSDHGTLSRSSMMIVDADKFNATVGRWWDEVKAASEGKESTMKSLILFYRDIQGSRVQIHKVIVDHETLKWQDHDSRGNPVPDGYQKLDEIEDSTGRAHYFHIVRGHHTVGRRAFALSGESMGEPLRDYAYVSYDREGVTIGDVRPGYSVFVWRLVEVCYGNGDDPNTPV